MDSTFVEMHPRRPLLKRAALWTGAVVLLLALYLAGEPVVLAIVYQRFPVLSYAVSVVYRPIGFYCERGFPGAGAYSEYHFWCYGVAHEFFRS